MPRRGRRWRRRRNRGSGSRQGHSLQVHTVAGVILRGTMEQKRAESNAEALATRLLGHNAAPVGSQGRATRASVTRLPGRGTRGWRGRIGGGIGVPSARIDQTKSYFGRGFWVAGMHDLTCHPREPQDSRAARGAIPAASCLGWRRKWVPALACGRPSDRGNDEKGWIGDCRVSAPLITISDIDDGDR